MAAAAVFMRYPSPVTRARRIASFARRIRARRIGGGSSNGRPLGVCPSLIRPPTDRPEVEEGLQAVHPRGTELHEDLSESCGHVRSPGDPSSPASPPRPAGALGVRLAHFGVGIPAPSWAPQGPISALLRLELAGARCELVRMPVLGVTADGRATGEAHDTGHGVRRGLRRTGQDPFRLLLGGRMRVGSQAVCIHPQRVSPRVA